MYERKSTSNFNVHMFDMTVSEIKNPCNTLVRLQESNHEYPCLLLHEEDDGLEKSWFVEDVDEHESLGNQNVKLKSARAKITSETLTRRWRAVTPEEKVRTIRAAHMFRSDNPFLQVILRPSYVYRGFLLHIPSFCSDFLGKGLQDLSLQVSGGKRMACPMLLQGCLQRLPKRFVRKFGEELSDVASVVVPTGHAWEIGSLFNETKVDRSKYEGELLEKCEEHMEIVVSGLSKASQESKRAIHAARKFKPKNPPFMYVPLGFAEKYLNQVSEGIKLQVSDGRL
ncbi:hypothetical protein POTOM_034685 [Populus tomentosa]|uniref:Uncharacterized protein n=1 Tax=Populus tomentosa TaxID=118781 RepID=A0A8X8CPQ1_POPTO|nr:hypothetical protein POTOM_034685 [Populus tomentosa]